MDENENDFSDEDIIQDEQIEEEFLDKDQLNEDIRNEIINQDEDELSNNINDTNQFPEEDFSPENEDFNESNLIKENESIEEQELDNLDSDTSGSDSQEIEDSDFDEFMNSKNQEILDSMKTVDKLDSSKSVSASTFHLRNRNKKLKPNDIKMELNSNQTRSLNKEEDSNVINLETGERRSRESRKVGESIGNIPIPKFRNTQVEMMGNSGKGGRGGLGGRVFDIMDSPKNGIRPINGTMFRMNGFQNLINDHLFMSEKFKKRRIEDNTTDDKDNQGIEAEIRNRFMNSSDDFNVIIDDKDQENKTIRYNMTAVNRSDE